jgi:RNA polymerase sigma-70 factor (ECF subfamily)
MVERLSVMTVRDLQHPYAPPAEPQAEGDGAGEDEACPPTTDRLRAVIDRHYELLWRTLHYLGIPEEAVEDAAQQALAVLARRLDGIAPGAEMSFLVATAVRVASDARRAAGRRPTVPVGDFETFPGQTPTADELLDERRAHAVLQEVLDAIPNDLRIVFVFFELEELPLAEIARILEIPLGTVSSRLRRAREAFHRTVERRSLRLAGRGEPQ